MISEYISTGRNRFYCTYVTWTYIFLHLKTRLNPKFETCISNLKILHNTFSPTPTQQPIYLLALSVTGRLHAKNQTQIRTSWPFATQICPLSKTCLMVHFCWRGNRCDIDISLLACNFRNLLDDRDIILGCIHNIIPKLTKLTICKTHMSTAQNLTSRVHFWSPGNRCGHSFFLSECNFWHTLHYRGIISGHMQNIIPKLSKSPVCKTHIPLLKT